MARPFARMPTLPELIRTLENFFGAALHESGGKTVGPRGKVTFRYLDREGRIAILPELPEDSRLVPSQVEALCQQLGVDPEQVYDRGEPN